METAFRQLLITFLTARNPTLHNENCIKGPNSKSQKFPNLFPAEIREWEEFNYESLILTFKKDLEPILHKEFSLAHPRDPPLRERQIDRESTLTCFLLYWTCRILNDALEVSQQELGDKWSPDKIAIVLGDRPQRRNGCKPDLAAIIESSTVSLSEIILPGEVKLSTKWRSTDIQDGQVDYASVFGSSESTEHWCPLNQLFRYCLCYRTKYGYIITDNELVVIKISLSIKYEGEGDGLSQEPGDSQESYKQNNEDPTYMISKHGCIEYKAIPWASHCQGERDEELKLTIHLALWFLHLMAKKEPKLPPIDHSAMKAKQPFHRHSTTEFESSFRSSRENQSFSSIGHLLEDPSISGDINIRKENLPARRSRKRQSVTDIGHNQSPKKHRTSKKREKKPQLRMSFDSEY